MNKILSSLLLIVLLFSTCLNAANAQSFNNGNEKVKFKTHFSLTEKEAKKIIKDQQKEINSLKTTHIIKTNKNSSKKSEIIVDVNLNLQEVLVPDSEVESNPSLELQELNISQEFIDKKGKVVTEEDILENVKNNNEIVIYDEFNNIIGGTPLVYDSKDMVSAQALTYIKQATKYYSFTTSVIYVYEEQTSSTSQRNYFRGRMTWPNLGYAGDVNTATSDRTANEVLVLAWDRGPTDISSNRNILLQYQEYAGGPKISRTQSSSLIKTHRSAGSRASAFQFDHSPIVDSKLQALTLAEMSAYTSYYNPTKFGDDASVLFEYAKGYSGATSPSFSVGFPASVGLSWSSTTKYEFAKIWATVPR